MLKIKELIQTIETIHTEKNIGYDDVVSAIERGLEQATKTQYGNRDIGVKILSKGQTVLLFHKVEVVADGSNRTKDQIYLSDAKKSYPGACVGDLIIEELPFILSSRIAAHAAKSIISQQITELERKKEYEKYEEKEGCIVTGTVKNIDNKGIYVSVDNAEIFIPKKHTIRSEKYPIESRIKLCILLERKEDRAPRVIGSRTSKEFLVGLFKSVVPEMEDGIVCIQSVLRDPGVKSKIAVYSPDPHIKPVGLCIGVGGTRIKSIKKELKTENVGVIEWVENPQQRINAAMEEYNLSFSTYNPVTNSAKVFIERRNINTYFWNQHKINELSEFLGVNIKLFGNDETLESVEEQERQCAQNLMNLLEIENDISTLLVASGFENIEKIVDSKVREISAATGMEEEIVKEIARRAYIVLDEQTSSQQTSEQSSYD